MKLLDMRNKEDLLLEYVRNAIGFHQMSHFFASMRCPLLAIENGILKIDDKIFNFVNLVSTPVLGIFLQLFDKLKDVIVILMIGNTFNQILEDEKWANSKAEQFYWVGLIVCLCFGVIAIGLYSFINRNVMISIKWSSPIYHHLFNRLLLLISPLLYIFYFIKLSITEIKLFMIEENYKKKKISSQRFSVGTMKLGEGLKEMRKLSANIKILEANLGCIIQLIFLISFLFFWNLDLYGSLANYTYFWSVANSIFGGKLEQI